MVSVDALWNHLIQRLPISVPFSLQCNARLSELTVNIECIRRGGVLESLTCSFDGQPEENCQLLNQ